MNTLIILHQSKDAVRSGANELLRFAISNEPVASVVFEGLKRSVFSDNKDEVVCAIPGEWGINHSEAGLRTVSYTEDAPICEIMQKNGRDPWSVISNGRFAAQINEKLLKALLSKVEADVVAITAKPELLAYREKVRFMAQGKVAGFRRLYVDCAEPQPVLIDCPHHIFIRTTVLDRLWSDVTIAQIFTDLQKLQYSNAFRFAAFGIAGHAWDFGTEEGLLNFCRTSLNSSRAACFNGNVIRKCKNFSEMGRGKSESPVLCEKVLVGKNVTIGVNVLVIGPAIIGDNVTIESGAVVNSSILGQNCSVRQGQFISNRIVKVSECCEKGLTPSADDTMKRMRYNRADFFDQQTGGKPFCSWPRVSYAGCFKRIFDIIVSAIVLILCLPIFLIIIVAIKLTSRGPVVFKDRRQGLHGRPFKCFKFRSMLVGADKMQNRLRILNDADGPQFKMADDPRLSPVGGFLREMYIDELLQFFNVLFGQMSIVGPRPSPESENTFCPFWRDARLSVRPGITGLWQICRTREPMRDFQEWIYYDIKYVKTLSLKLDVWICWQTAMRMVRNFVKQF
jgi:lipopolysaccharide/colanic/teichoic acid biosynthesis glycosyltransferase